MATEINTRRRSFLRLKQVMDRTGMGRSKVYEEIAKGKFPKQIRLGGPDSRAVGWLEDEVENWMDEQVRNSRGPETVRPAIAVRQAG